VPDRYTSIIDAHVLLWRDGKVLFLRCSGKVFATGKLSLTIWPPRKGRAHCRYRRSGNLRRDRDHTRPG
jgi:hypothetical protein